MKQKVSAKEIAQLLLRFTVAEPPHRQMLMSSLADLNEFQRAKIRDEMMFLDLVIIGILIQTDRAKQYWQNSEDVLVQYHASLKKTLEIGGGDFEGLLGSLEAREAAYKKVLPDGGLERPLNVARFAVGQIFAILCGCENDPSVEITGMGEFVSVVNHVGTFCLTIKSL